MSFHFFIFNLRFLRAVPGWILLATVLSGCARAPHQTAAGTRPFSFEQDRFAYANELVWDYHFDVTTGRTTHARHQPPPDYTHHCFVVARSARQFFQHARFDAHEPVADTATCRRLIRRVMRIDPSRRLSEEAKIVIPGYANLHEFSRAHEALLKAECGGAWRSYFQRGHWRMLFPLSRTHQEKEARRLTAALQQNRPPVVHLVRFPRLSINHAVVVFDARETEREIQFAAYDPNSPDRPTHLTYDRQQRRFHFPANPYFAGGRVDVYEIYRKWNY